LLDDLQTGRCGLIVDICNEGPAFSTAIFDALHLTLDQHSVPRDRVAWATQNRRTAGDYEAAYGRGVHFIAYDFYIKALLRVLADPGQQAFGGDVEKHLALLQAPELKDRTFLCLNAEPRMHRILTVAALRHVGLFDDALITFGGFGMSKSEPGWMAQLAAGFLAGQPRYEKYARDFEYVCGLNGFNYPGGDGNTLVMRFETEAYHQTFFSVVTETDFSGGEVVRITEKALKAVALGHPVHIVGNPCSLPLLEELGFEPMNEAGYDHLLSPPERFEAMIEAVEAEVRSIKSDPVNYLARRQACVRRNVLHAAGGEALRAYEQRYDQPAARAMRAMVG
jgi:hypothetical protein